MNPHKVFIRDWAGQKNVHVFWCPVAQTILFEKPNCPECGKKVKR